MGNIKQSWVPGGWGGVQAHLACSKGLDRLWVESKETKVWKQSILTYSFLNVYSVFEKSDKIII